MKKKIGIAFTALTCLLLLPLFAACKPIVNPYRVNWQLNYYEKDGAEYSTRFDEMDYFSIIPLDTASITFTEPKGLSISGSFSFKDCTGASFTGKYTYRKRGDNTVVNLSFSSGEKVSAKCTVSGSWVEAGTYTLSFEMDGVTYHFMEKGGRDNALENGLLREGRRLREYEESGGKNGNGLKCGEVMCEDGVWYLTLSDENGEWFRYSLSRKDEEGNAYYFCTVYEYDSEYTITETALREGSCAVKYSNTERFAIHFRAENWEEAA